MPTPDFERPDFDALCDAFTEQRIHDVNPAEIQGLACGVLAAGSNLSTEQWLTQIEEYSQASIQGLAGPGFEVLAARCGELFQACRVELESSDFDLYLCLPDEDIYSLMERSESLALWCQGFLHGFAAVQMELSEEHQEVLRDLTEISKLSMSADDVDAEEANQNESYYTELEEFVRMAAMSLFLDCSREGGKDKKEGDVEGVDRVEH